MEPHVGTYGAECQKKAQQHHQYECSILGILKNSGISVICYMAVRILTKNNPKTVLEWYGLAEKTELEEMSQSLENKVPMDQSNNCLDKTRTLETLGFNEEYRTDHVALFHLVTHSQRREPEEYFHQIVMALYLLEVLKTTSYFDQFKSCASGKSDTKQENGIGGTSLPSRDQRCEESLRENGKKSPDELTPTSISQNEPACLEDIPREVEIKFAVLLLRCLKSLQFNTHETAAWDEESDKDNSVGLGGALYPTLAPIFVSPVFNHSCNPAIVRYFVNDTVVVRAIRTIVPGEVVTENYGPNYSNVPLEERQMRLNDVYWFKCECIACLQNWPAFSEMTNDMMKFRCEFCRTFICKSDENMGILFNCGKCGKSVNVLKAMKAIHETDAKYSQAVQFINSGNFETGLGMIQENLFTLEKFLMPPFREFHMCQEHMRRCYLTLGNRVSKLPAWDPETVKMDD
ncbi:SET and MYND domain-containing protein 4 [Folsomia candida]|uniref:SET and MYND domain-containing protein 4 n=1 Tax=Folsomia candida TaxID=158441 RepID=A0A226EWQ6_FOLCA|nr:SET and MYND domain-containing protein 4 [Folsomia candida]